MRECPLCGKNQSLQKKYPDSSMVAKQIRSNRIKIKQRNENWQILVDTENQRNKQGRGKKITAMS